MYKNLNASSLGISGRLNELIELTLTYKFRGFDLDLVPLVQQAETRGVEHATRYLSGATILIGSFELPIDVTLDDAEFAAALGPLEGVGQVAQAIGAKTALLDICPYSETRPYHQNFELHTNRLGQVADLLARFEIGLGLGFLAPAYHRKDRWAQFIATPDALLTLIKMIPSKNVGLCLDTWHWYVGGGTLQQLEDVAIDRLMMVRVADLPADALLEAVTEQDRLLPGATEVVPNSQWVKWLATQGYEGPVTAYAHAAQFTGSTRTQSVEQTAEALNQLLAQTIEEAEQIAAASSN